MCGGEPKPYIAKVAVATLFPACAGVNPPEEERPELIETFPRMCGGEPSSVKSRGKEISFSPHVRG